jgi:hypothetical protein
LKQIAILFCCFLTVSALAQNSSNKKAPPVGASSFSANQSKMLCKAWKLDSTSAFSVTDKPSDKEVNDGVTFVADGNCFLTQEGVASTGIWAYAGGRINVAIKTLASKISFKLISLTDTKLVVEYQSPDLIRTEYIYSPKK